MSHGKRKRHPYCAACFISPKLGYFWVVATPSPDDATPDTALAEGFEPTQRQAQFVSQRTAMEIGARTATHFDYLQPSDAKHFYYSRNPRKVKPPPNMDGPPSLTTFQGSPHLYRHYHYQAEIDREEHDIWKEHLVVRVTPKFVFVFMGKWASLCRLDRAKLERDGVAQGGGKHAWDVFYTPSGRDAYMVAAETKRQQKLEHRARRAEELKQALVGKTCVFCGTEPEVFTEDRYPTCRPCYRQNSGHYRLAPGHTIINVLGG